MNDKVINNLCRLCATQELDLNLLENDFDKGISKRKLLLTLVNKYLKIKVTDAESLPRKFCGECVQKLLAFDLFNRRCHDVQAMFVSISNGNPLSDNHKELLQQCSFLSELDLALSKRVEVPEKSEKNPYSDDDDFTWEYDANDDNEDDDQSWEPDIEDTPLALRVQKKVRSCSDSKRKRGRPKKVCPKVPPLRIKAIKSDESVENAKTSDSVDTKYEIHDDSNEAQQNDQDEKSESGHDSTNEDNESDDSNYVDESLSTEEKKETNPFSLFEFRCTVCQELFSNFSVLKKHCKQEHGSSAFVNCVCGKQLRARTAIIEHRRKHTGTSLYKCDTCNKTFNRRSLMCLHKMSHVPKDEQPYVCCKCAKRFHTASLLKKHEKVHLPEEERFLDVCNICQKRFTSKSSVNAHLRAVHYGEKPFVCEHCGNSFSSKAILTDHLTTHSTYAPWPCDVCKRNFKSKYRLNVHMDMHRSVKYRCPHCPMELSTRRTLRMHLLVHKEEKAYVCKVCSKAFRRSKDLKNHSNLHTGRRPYQCEFCDRTFANGSNCRAHKLRMHPEELGVEKSSRSSSKPAKNAAASKKNVPAVNAEPTATGPPPPVPVEPAKSVPKSPPKEQPYEMKYEFPAAAGHESEYSLEYARYLNPMGWNMKKPQFVQPPNINHLSQFASDHMHSEVPKVPNFLSYT
ncbi:hypothetical protein V9T40_003157 [Parthenolecanium corni]|uniref:Uncharacterized protein n=1 Tax=Parthenolecanium corni TaxID=536013 RepID=A0AAN9U2B8_9HEMI